MEELIILGAGASVDADVPLSSQMISRMINHPENDRRFSSVLEFALGGTILQNSIKETYSPANIEDLFNAVELLSRRNTMEGAAFVGNWHPYIEQLDKIPAPFNLRNIELAILGSVTKSLKESTSEVGNLTNSFSEIDQEIKNGSAEIGKKILEKTMKAMDFVFTKSYDAGGFIVIDKKNRKKTRLEQLMALMLESYTKTGTGQIFRSAMKRMNELLVEFAYVKNPDKVQYLFPLVKSCFQRKIPIITLNYDNSLELAAKLNSIDTDKIPRAIIDQKEFSFDSGKLRIVPLHGSILWINRYAMLPNPVYASESYRTLLEIPMEEVENKKPYIPYLIFGGKNKLTAEGPFLDLLNEFMKYLGQTERIIVIGYSFRDDHVNWLLRKWLITKNNGTINIINNPTGCGEFLTKYLMHQEEFKNRILIIGQRAIEGIQQKFGETKSKPYRKRNSKK